MKLIRALSVCALAVVLPARAAADEPFDNQPTSVTAPAGGEDSVLARFSRSNAGVSSELGSGTFVRGEFADDPYFATELTLEPRFNLNKSLNARALFALSCELTEPNGATARRCSPSDVRLSLHAPRIVTDPLLGGNVSVSFAFYLPASYESRFNNTVTNLRASAGYSASFDVGLGTLSLGYNLALQKYLPTRRVRGFTVGEAGGEAIPLVNARSSAAEDGAIGSGGRMNDNWLMIHSAQAGWAFADDWDVSVLFAIYDYYRFAVDPAFSDPNLLQAGRVQLTAGTVELSHALAEHISLAFGVTSFQPALTADNSSLRFPFYDFISPANNYSKWYLNATFSL